MLNDLAINYLPLWFIRLLPRWLQLRLFPPGVKHIVATGGLVITSLLLLTDKEIKTVLERHEGMRIC